MKSIVHRRRGAALAPALALALALGGCSAPKQAPQATPYVAQDAAAAPGGVPRNAGYSWTTSMNDSSQRLQGALRGSAASVSQTTDQRLWVSLPIDAAFARGRSAVKPAATAALDQVALALRANARAQVLIVGDGDVVGAGASALALDRAASARDWMVARGVFAGRIVVASRNARGGTPAGDGPRLDVLIGEHAGGAAAVH
jgi:outer membrane protein OmpA-like peptidoglycan-associated protein